MKKFINIFLAVLITLFSFPINGASVNAEGNTSVTPDKVQTFEYEVPAADNFFVKPGVLLEKDNKQYIQIQIENWSVIDLLKADEIEVDVVEVEDDIALLQFPYNGEDLSEPIELYMEMSYGGKHDADLIIDPDSFTEADKSEYELYTKPTESEDPEDDDGSDSGKTPSRSDENLIKEEEATAVDKVEPISSLSLSRYFEIPFKLLEVDEKRYIQVKGIGMGNSLTSLTVNGQEVTWGEVKEDGTYTFQFEVQGPLSEILNLAMEIDTGNPQFGVMTHSGTLSFGKKYSLDDEINVTGDEIVLVDDVQLTVPAELGDNIKLKVTKNGKKIEIPKNLEQAGGVYNFEFTNLKANAGKFDLIIGYDSKVFPEEEYEVDIYYFDEVEKKWIAQNGHAENSQVKATVDHFSTYGVFAMENRVEDEEKPKDEEKSDELKVSEINYEVKHETEDKASSANAFFKKPGYILKQDGETYFQTYITSWQMIDWLKYEGTDVEVIKIESDSQGETAFVQMKIDADLTKEIGLNMHITVPGMYKMEHDARLVFDVNSEQPIDSDGFSVYKAQDSGGQGGTPPTPTPGKPGGKVDDSDDKKPKKEKTDKVKPDKVSKIDYTILQADNDEVSAADAFFKKPATLLEKDGKKYLQFTVTSWSMVNWLKVNGKDVLVISEDKKNDSATVQIEIDGDLSKYITLGMKITVPGLYEMEHDARLVMFPETMEETDVDGHYIYTGVAKPGDFGEGENGKGKEKKETDNPKTGDTSQIFFFTMLLIGSLGVLAVQLRRRLVA